MKNNSFTGAHGAFAEIMEGLVFVMKAISTAAIIIGYILLVIVSYEQAPVIGMIIGMIGLIRAAYTYSDIELGESVAVRAEVKIIELHAADVRAKSRSKKKAA